MIDMRHKLELLAGLIDRERFDESPGGRHAEKGRPRLPTGLTVGLHFLSVKNYTIYWPPLMVSVEPVM